MEQLLDPVEWAGLYGDRFEWSTPLDRFDPPRNIAVGVGWRFQIQQGTDRYGVILEDVSELREGRESFYLLDDGQTIAVFYVAGWHEQGKHVVLHPLASMLSLAPRRCYHVRVKP